MNGAVRHDSIFFEQFVLANCVRALVPVWTSEKIVLRPDIGYSKYHFLPGSEFETLYPDTGAVHVPEFCWCEYLEKGRVHIIAQRESRSGTVLGHFACT